MCHTRPQPERPPPLRLLARENQSETHPTTDPHHLPHQPYHSSPHSPSSRYIIRAVRGTIATPLDRRDHLPTHTARNVDVLFDFQCRPGMLIARNALAWSRP